MERESIRKPLAAGVKVWDVVESALSIKQSPVSSNTHIHINTHKGRAKLHENCSEAVQFKEHRQRSFLLRFNRPINVSLNCK